MRTKNVQTQLDISDVWSVDSGFVRRAEQYLEEGDVLISSANSWNLVGKCCWIPKLESATSFGGFVTALRGDENLVDRRYLYRWFASAGTQRTVRSFSRQTTNISNLDLKRCADLPVPLPSLVEQRRIAAVLDQVDTLRAKRREAITLLDDLAQSIFLGMFGDPVRNEKSWPVGKVADLVASFESGKSLAQGQDEGAKFRVLKVSAVTSGIFRPLESKPLPVAYEVPYGHLVRQGDLLFSRANTEELIGAVSLVEGHHENLALSDKLWRFVWHDSVDSHPLYVRHLFRQGEFRRQVRERSSGTSGSMKNISQANVLGIACGIPPIELRKEFSDRMQGVARLQTSHRLHLAALDELFESLQQRAFSGQLSTLGS